jgi:MFS family permease
MLAILFAFHLLESIDRWLLPAVLPHVQEELKLSNSEAAWLTTVLLVSFALASPVIGYFADRMNRRRLLATGVAVWGLATMWTGLAKSYEQLQAARAIAGIGGATIGVVGLTLLMDAFPRQVRARILAVYFLAMPLGAAVGLISGAFLARATGWQIAFLTAGSVGVFSALAAFLLPEPARGASEGIDERKLLLHERVGPSQEDYIDLMVNSSYTYSVFGLIFSAFAIGGLGYWLPSFLAVVKRLPEGQATTGLGLVTLSAAVVGMGLGAVLADRLARRGLRALFLVPAVAVFLAIPCYLAALSSAKPAAVLTFVFLTECLLWFPLGPCYAIIAGVAMPNMRAVGVAAAFCAGHFLGDIWSPSLMGWAVDTFGQADAMATSFGQALAAIGAVPIRQPRRDPENLTAGMLVVVPAMLIAGGVLVAGARHLPREMALMLAKLRAAPSRYARARPRPVPSPRR